MENNVSYKNRIIWQDKREGFFHALGGLHADTLDGMKKLIDEKINNEDNRIIVCKIAN